MGKFIDLTGRIFGNWTVLGYVGESYWLCKCKCGKEKSVNSYNLINQKTRSCGCLKNKDKITHHQSNSKLYNVWRGIKTRCYNKNSNKFYLYGGRGISMCDAWKNNFSLFLDWSLKNGYTETGKYGEYTIDRINLNGNYEPSNCRWVNLFVQANNTRKNKLITYKHQTHTLGEWSRLCNINYRTLYTRIFKLHWDIEKALSTATK